MTARPTQHGRTTRRRRIVRRIVAGLAASTLALAACGGDDDAADEFAGYVRTPAPEVGELSLPDVGDDGAEFAFQAADDELLVVYFGFTNCPDFCPTTMSDLSLALARLDSELAERVQVAMVTVDPERDLPVLDGYVNSFVEGAHALGTDDPARLEQVAAPFGAAYDIEVIDGEPEVGHTTSLYAIDDRGRLVLTWPFGVSIEDLEADIEALLERTESA